jgi:hypothetical protein
MRDIEDSTKGASKGDSSLWFPEPATPDESWANRGESTCGWLARSTLPRARESRRFLNENLAKLPAEAQSHLAQALQHRWRSAFFEIVLARLLQEWGAVLELEVANAEGRRPDLLARFDDATVIVEAVSPVFNGAMGDEFKSKDVLLEIVEGLVPEGCRVGAWRLPNIGLSDSRKEFKRAVQEMMAPFTAESVVSLPDEGVELNRHISSGEINIHLFPAHVVRGDRRRSLFGPAVSGADDSKSRIERAVHRKRSQVRASGVPVLLAIDAGSLTCDLEDFDQALIGHSFVRLDIHHRPVETGFHLDGLLWKRGAASVPPTYAGVLAFLNIGFYEPPPPVLYPHPRFTGALGEAMQRLPRRTFCAETKRIEQQQGQADYGLERLHFVSRQ